MTKKSNIIMWHLAGCITFLVIPIILSPRPAHMPLLSQPTLRDLLANCLMLIIFYLNYYLLIPRLYFNNKHIWYGLLILLGFLAITFLPSIMAGHNPWRQPMPPPPDMSIGQPPVSRDGASFLVQVSHNIFLYVAVVLFSILLRIKMKLYDTELLKHDAEIGILKGQINPHFLFNTLNNIYAFAIREKSPDTASGILKLSAMMRYVVTEARQEFVPLAKEIGYTNDYIDLQRMRLTSNMHLSYVVTGTVTDQKIAPVILMPFIENAFKHGVNPDQESYLNVKINVSGPFLELTVENQKVKASQELHIKSGVGITNTKARLELIYPGKYLLSVNDEENHYRIKLKIELK